MAAPSSKTRLVCPEKRVAVADDVVVASSFFARLRGLMFRSELAPDSAVAITDCSMVHTFFMRFAIDVLFCTDELKVVGIAENLRPWRLSKFYRGATCAIEVAAGQARKAGLASGDQLRLELRMPPAPLGK